MELDLIERESFICPRNWKLRVASIETCIAELLLSYDAELFIMLTNLFSGAKRVNIKMKVIEQYSHELLFVPRYFYKMEFGISSNFAWVPRL